MNAPENKNKKTRKRSSITRRKVITGIGAAAGLSVFSTAAKSENVPANVIPSSISSKDAANKIFNKVSGTPFIDTHEHLPDESARL